MTSTKFRCESAINRGGEIDSENGLSVLRRELKATIMASGGEGVARKAVRISVVERGVPWTRVRPGWAGIEDGERTRAVTVCFLFRASWMMSCPVRPEPPRMRICISRGGWGWTD